jgi:hypothetical protein
LVFVVGRTANMIYEETAPAAGLEAYVEAYWRFAG